MKTSTDDNWTWFWATCSNDSLHAENIFLSVSWNLLVLLTCVVSYPLTCTFTMSLDPSSQKPTYRYWKSVFKSPIKICLLYSEQAQLPQPSLQVMFPSPLAVSCSLPRDGITSAKQRAITASHDVFGLFLWVLWISFAAGHAVGSCFACCQCKSARLPSYVGSSLWHCKGSPQVQNFYICSRWVS